MSFLGVVVENIVDYLGSGKGYAVPGLRFNGAPVVDCGSPEVHQYGAAVSAARRLRRMALVPAFCTLRISLPRVISLALPVDDKFML